MSSYAMYCQKQAADCARRARIASSPDIVARYRQLGLEWVKLAQRERAGMRSWFRRQTQDEATAS